MPWRYTPSPGGEDVGMGTEEGSESGVALEAIGRDSAEGEEPGCAHRGEERFPSVSGQQAAGKGRRDMRRPLLLTLMRAAAAAPPPPYLASTTRSQSALIMGVFQFSSAIVGRVVRGHGGTGRLHNEGAEGGQWRQS
ncbi:hypothetical protein E2C01_014865 [Portunus trituberculatus]|uniref:Uncharacterized protein n=1 Tax=Portunus trituberculatus TaxID=210409 RepID=A0A5B7DL44_PORTR|nr:hypothetical protein [Portunus trituberculatus]